MKILENKLINKAELARQLWPGKKSSAIMMAHKISGHRGRHFNESEKERIKELMTGFAEKLLNDTKNEDFI